MLISHGLLLMAHVCPSGDDRAVERIVNLEISQRNFKRSDIRTCFLCGTVAILLLGLLVLNSYGQAADGTHAEQTTRKLKSSVPPEYPELARRMKIKGTARVQATITPDGSVKDVKEVGGNPVLLEALSQAVKKWKYVPAPNETVVEIKFDFIP